MNEQFIQAEAALRKAVNRNISHGEISLTLILRDARIIRYEINTTESTLLTTKNEKSDINTEFRN